MVDDLKKFNQEPSYSEYRNINILANICLSDYYRVKKSNGFNIVLYIFQKTLLRKSCLLFEID